MRVLHFAVLSLVTLAFAPACSSRPNLVEFWAQPEVACPGDVVTVRAVLEKAESARLEVAPPPASGVAPATWSPGEPLSARDIDYRLCTSTELDLVAWNGTAAGACDADNTRCAGTFVSVVEADHLETLEVDPCASSRFGNTARVVIAREDYSASFVVAAIENCGPQVVRLNRDGREAAPVAALPGGPFAGFEGEPWVGTWTASQTVGPGEECPPEGDIAPSPAPRPDAICLRFTVRCPGSDDCG